MKKAVEAGNRISNYDGTVNYGYDELDKDGELVAVLLLDTIANEQSLILINQFCKG